MVRGRALGLSLLLLLLCGCGVAAGPAAEPGRSDARATRVVSATPPPSPISEPTAAPTATAVATAAASAAAVAPSATAVPGPIVPPKPGAVTVVPILMYHYIRYLPANTPDQLGYGLSIAPQQFEEQMAYLQKAGYNSVSMAVLTSHITTGTALPAKPIVLSFDDGYADFYTAAFPVLQKYHFAATTYLVVDFLGRPGYMSWQQAQQLQDAGMEIGAHTMDHVDLAIQPLAQAHHQIFDSRTALKQRLNAPVTTFAYPSGRYTASTVKLVAEDGFTSAVTTNFGDRHTAANLLTLSRVRVPGGISLQRFVANLG